MANPNRVRSLVGTFSSANQTGFHRADGEGYRFFAETVLEVEKRNPQVAARLATALRSWRSLEPVRQAKAREALLAIAECREPVGRSARHRRAHAGVSALPSAPCGAKNGDSIAPASVSERRLILVDF